VEKYIIEENADLYFRRAPFIPLSIPFLFLYIFALLFSDGTCAERNVLQRLLCRKVKQHFRYTASSRLASFLSVSRIREVSLSRVDMRNDESAARREITRILSHKIPAWMENALHRRHHGITATVYVYNLDPTTLSRC